MKQKQRKLVVAFLFGLGLTTVQAQEALGTAGGDASGSGGTASYSIGQLVYTTSTSGTASVAQGVQQAFEISIITGLEEVPAGDLQLSAYPNPASDQLTLTAEKDPVNLYYQLFDIHGKLLSTEKLVGKQTFIKMALFPPAAYLIKVSDPVTVLKTFKIIKN